MRSPRRRRDAISPAKRKARQECAKLGGLGPGVLERYCVTRIGIGIGNHTDAGRTYTRRRGFARDQARAYQPLANASPNDWTVDGRRGAERGLGSRRQPSAAFALEVGMGGKRPLQITLGRRFSSL